jgi:hypothetical protein
MAVTADQEERRGEERHVEHNTSLLEVDPSKNIPLGQILGNDPPCCAGAWKAGTNPGMYAQV